ncbi:glycosyltransferase [Paracoccus sp. M683]|uniref:glycosyltransferase n=1 Tax=Paracoccus sp. M683 TaxID=2594268 RepID=UPI00117EE1D7|nr:glycosyltransferase [Paracoccus sp. M683]TRW99469.1 glycosyltransferase [Paracoccus sp. M683]
MPDLAPVTILMAVYDGGAHLAQQLDSFAMQDHREWRLIISDDGSDDDSRVICAGFRDRMGADRVQLIDGPRAGPTRNFLHLVDQAPDGVPLAFSDQDDVWLPHKMTRAMTQLADAEGPTLYCARTLICDQALQNRQPSRLFKRPHGFRNALVQACTPGNSSVFNLAAAALLKRGVQAAMRHDLPAHDWWAYQLVSGAGGTVIFDAEPVLLYRQHDNNVMGRNDTPRGMLRRMGMLMQGEYGDWLTANTAALTEGAPLLSPENRDILARFRRMLDLPGPAALRELRRLGLYRQTAGGNAALMAAAAMGRLRQRG